MKKILFVLSIAGLMVSASCTKSKTSNSGIDEEPTPNVPAEKSVMLEDFEGETGMLVWNGRKGATFSLADNPLKEGINTSKRCGKVLNSGAKWEFTYSSAFGGNENPEFLDFTNNGYLIKVMVKGPKAGSPVFLKLEGIDVQPKEITSVKTTKADEWEELVFDYEPLSMADGAYKNFVILFDAGVETEGGEEFFFDNVRQCKL